MTGTVKWFNNQKGYLDLSLTLKAMTFLFIIQDL